MMDIQTDMMTDLMTNSIAESMQLPTEISGFISYGGEWCGFCRKAKKILKNDHRVTSFEWVEIPNTKEEKESVKDKLRSMIGDHNTFPIVFYDLIFVGGSDAIMPFLDSDEFKKREEEKKKMNKLCEDQKTLEND